MVATGCLNTEGEVRQDMADEITGPTPIMIDPEIQDIVGGTPPTLRDFERAARDHECVWSDRANPDTIDELIATLEGLRDKLGGDTEVRDLECGARIHVSASEYDDGTTVVRL